MELSDLLKRHNANLSIDEFHGAHALYFEFDKSENSDHNFNNVIAEGYDFTRIYSKHIDNLID